MLSHEEGYDGDSDECIEKARKGEVRSKRLAAFQNAFRERLGDVAGKRISRKVAVINRRLDALARLLERDQTCVAVRYDFATHKIVIASNKVYETSHETNNSIRNIKKLMELLAKHEATMEEIMDELSVIIAENLRQEFRYKLDGKSLADIQKEVQSQLENLLNSGEQTKVWEELAIQDLLGFDAALVKRTSRLARDFIKLRKSVLHLAHADGQEKEILEAIRKGKFSLCKTGAASRHAEIRQVEELAMQANSQPPYIGISKLCCARCSLVVEVLGIPTRGSHGQIFNKWQLPEAIKKKPEYFAQYLGSARRAYNVLSSEDEEKALAIIEDGKKSSPSHVPKLRMMADTSSSDEAFGFSDVSDEVVIGDLTVAELVEAKTAKNYDEEAYRTLRTSLSPCAVSGLFKKSPEKFEVLARCRKKYGDEIDLDSWGDLFEEDQDLFDYVFEDEADLIARAGFEEACQYYRRALEKSGKYEDDSCQELEHFDVNAEANASYLSENGYDMFDSDCTSDSSQYHLRCFSD